MDIVLFALQHRTFFVGLHLFGVVLGFGGAVMADIFFVKLLRKLSATDAEIDVLKTFSKIIWFGLLIIVFSGIFVFLSGIEGYSQSPKFLTKMLAVLVIIINGFFLNIVASPKLSASTFHNLMTSNDGKDKKSRRMLFASGAISAVSWWTAFILGALNSLPASFQVLVSIYLLLLFGAVVASQIFANRLSSYN